MSACVKVRALRRFRNGECRRLTSRNIGVAAYGVKRKYTHVCRYFITCVKSVVYGPLSGYPMTPMRINWRDGDVIRRLRDQAGWTLEQLAEVSTVNPQTIHRLEKGKTKEAKRETLERIAHVFGLTERQLRDALPPPMELPFHVAPDVAAFVAGLQAGSRKDQKIAAAINAVNGQKRRRRR